MGCVVWIAFRRWYENICSYHSCEMLPCAFLHIPLLLVWCDEWRVTWLDNHIDETMDNCRLSPEHSQYTGKQRVISTGINTKIEFELGLTVPWPLSQDFVLARVQIPRYVAFFFCRARKSNHFLAYTHLHDFLCFAWWNLHCVQPDPISLQVAKECYNAGDILGPNLILHHLDPKFCCLMKIIHLQMLICGRLPGKSKSSASDSIFIGKVCLAIVRCFLLNVLFPQLPCTEPAPDGSPSCTAKILLAGGCICNC